MPHRLASVCLVSLALAAGCTAASPEGSIRSSSTSQTPSAEPTPTADPPPASVAGLPFTAVEADAASAGAITVEMNAFTYVPDKLSAKAGTVVLFLKDTTARQPHNMNIGPSLGQPLVASPDVPPGKGLLLTIEGLTPGSYVFWDSLYRQEEHAYFYELGMVGTLTITP